MTVLPRLLIIDDQFGRSLRERRNLCALFGLSDVTEDDPQQEMIRDPIAEAVFCSGQQESVEWIQNSLEVAITVVGQGWPLPDLRRWALLLLDLRFVSGDKDQDGQVTGRPGDDEFGLAILRTVRRDYPDLPVVILSGRDRTEVIEACRTGGASDFIQRQDALAGTAVARELLARKLHEYGLIEDDRRILVGHSVTILKAMAAARRAATGAGNVLLIGETGTGKELFARYVHDHSPKAKGPYVVFHPFGRGESLQEDELFGHVKGAFTGATSDRPGLFEAAHGGTLFIDEVGDIPESLQSKLLRPIESRAVVRQGDLRERHVDVQLVLATNKELEQAVQTGRFKIDLLNRIAAFPIRLPPLVERREDIPLLARVLLEQLCRTNQARWPREITNDALQWLLAQQWREGNVRELRNVLERAVKDHKDAEILVRGDLELRTEAGSPSSEVHRVSGVEEADWPSQQSLKSLLTDLAKISLPEDYEQLHGSLPLVQQAVARLLGRTLLAALETTRRRRPGGPSDGALNLTAAASCLMGKQLSTAQACDLVKRIVHTDPTVCEELLNEFPLLREAYDKATKLRSRRVAAS